MREGRAEDEQEAPDRAAINAERRRAGRRDAAHRRALPRRVEQPQLARLVLLRCGGRCGEEESGDGRPYFPSALSEASTLA